MSIEISRVCVVATPKSTNREFQKWEPASIVVFVRADTKDAAIEAARTELARLHWNLVRVELCDRLIEDRIREQNGEILRLYLDAVANGVATKIFPKNFGAGPQGISAIRPPRVTEEFIDLIVQDVGGHRLPVDNQNRIADYRIGDWIFELKDLQEEGLEKSERREKLAALFAQYAGAEAVIRLDPAILPESEHRRYYDILSTPIQNQVKSASKQIRKTKQSFGSDSFHGGLIFLNTGYGSFPHDEFGPLVERYVGKDTTQIEAIFCISTFCVTNGFDSYIFYQVYPKESENDVVVRLRAAFEKRFEESMTKIIVGGLPKSAELADPLAAITFQVNGLDFAWEPPLVPNAGARKQN